MAGMLEGFEKGIGSALKGAEGAVGKMISEIIQNQTGSAGGGGGGGGGDSGGGMANFDPGKAMASMAKGMEQNIFA